VGAIVASVPENAVFITIGLFASDGTPTVVDDLTGSEVFYFQLPVPNCTAYDACALGRRA